MTFNIDWDQFSKDLGAYEEGKYAEKSVPGEVIPFVKARPSKPPYAPPQIPEHQYDWDPEAFANTEEALQQFFNNLQHLFNEVLKHELENEEDNPVDYWIHGQGSEITGITRSDGSPLDDDDIDLLASMFGIGFEDDDEEDDWELDDDYWY